MYPFVKIEYVLPLKRKISYLPLVLKTDFVTALKNNYFGLLDYSVKIPGIVLAVRDNRKNVTDVFLHIARKYNKHIITVDCSKYYDVKNENNVTDFLL